MKQERPALAILVFATIIFVSQSVVGEVTDWKWKNIGGTNLRYKVILPNGYDPTREYPAVLAFPGGEQSRPIVDDTLERIWRAEAERRGYIVVVPAAPGHLFFQGGEKVFPDFLIKLLSDYKIRDNKFYIAGASNGGISAFHIAASYPEYFWSVTGFPGFLPDPTPERVRALANMCINMHVGELDVDWLDQMQKQATQFRSQGLNVQFTVEKDQAHRLQTFEGESAARLFDEFEAARHGCVK